MSKVVREFRRGDGKVFKQKPAKRVPAASKAPPDDHRVYAEWFDARLCEREGCDHADERIELRGACHPEAAARARYNFTLRTLSIVCSACGLGIAEVGVAMKAEAKPVPARAPPVFVQKMDQRAKKNRARRK